MEQIMKGLQDLELRQRLLDEFKGEDEEQEAFEKRLRARDSIPAINEMQRRQPKPPKHNPAVRQAVRNSLGRSR